MTTVEILRAAKAELLSRGWCQGIEQNHVGSVCIAGALNLAVTGSADHDPTGATNIARIVMGRAIEASGRHTCWSLELWNDLYDRKPEDVLDVFDVAIDLALQDESVSAVVVPTAVASVVSR